MTIFIMEQIRLNLAYHSILQPLTRTGLSTMARTNTHNTEVGAGDMFGDTYVTDPADTYPLLAHSGYGSTWPKK